jgi:plastocyanin
MRRSRLPLLLVLALVPGCGADDDEGGRSVTTRPGETLRIVADEYSFDPARVTMSGPGRFRFELLNQGDLAHNLRLLRDGEELGGTPSFAGGEKRAASVRLEPGSYELVCTVGDHEQLGMTGRLDVR